MFQIKVVEDSQGPLRFCLPWSHEGLDSSSDSLADTSSDEGFKDDVLSLASGEDDGNVVLEPNGQKHVLDQVSEGRVQ